MENIVENKVKSLINKYRYYIVLCILICILFCITGYTKQHVDYTVYLEDEKLELSYDIYESNNEQYIHIEDVITGFKDYVYNDKIAGKIIITTDNNVKKISKTDENYVIKMEGSIYFNLKKIVQAMGKGCYVVNDKIYILANSSVEGTSKDNRVEVYDIITGNIVGFLNKEEKVKILTHYLVEDANKINIVTAENVYGYVLKSHISFEYQNDTKSEALDKKIVVRVEGKIDSSTVVQAVDIIAVNMYRLSGIDNLVKLEYDISNLDKTKIYAVINNGQKSSNYDASILSEMLYSESNRAKIIEKTLEYTKNLAGVNIDFGSFKIADKDNFTQFIKELSSAMHEKGKKVIVNVPSTQYIDIKQISKVVDCVIVQPYFERTIASKTSGSISSVKYVESFIQNLLTEQIDVEKIVLEVPTYSILWTERKGTVINAEQYTMKTTNQYIKTNKLEVKLDSASGQNYINYTKGITTYKMWLEDEYSINEKAKLAVKYNLAGISIYKSGFETKGIYDKILSTLDK